MPAYRPSQLEVPSFLGADSARPSDDDQAVLEEFMGAVLGQQVVEQPEVEPSAPAKPHTPVEEPAFMSERGPR